MSLLIVLPACQSSIELDDLNYDALSSAAYEFNSIDISQLSGDGASEQSQLTSLIIPALLGLTILATVTDTNNNYTMSVEGQISGTETSMASEWIE